MEVLVFYVLLFFLMGFWVAFPLLMFYTGRRRDLIFADSLNWMIRGKSGGVLMLLSLLFLLPVCSLFFQLTAFYYFAGLVAVVMMPLWWHGLPAFMRRFPPGWLYDFHDGRSPEDTAAVYAAGRAMLRTNPEAFRRIINQPEGWDSWILTV
jgi:hypothetical protein